MKNHSIITRNIPSAAAALAVVLSPYATAFAAPTTESSGTMPDMIADAPSDSQSDIDSSSMARNDAAERSNNSSAAATTGDDSRGRMNSDTSRGTANPGNITVESVTKITKDIRDQDRQAVSLAAGRLLVHVSRANDELQRDENDKALVDVEKALMLAKIIERNVSVYQVTTNIRSGDLTYTSNDEISDTTVPVFTELERVELLGPIVEAKRQGGTPSEKGSEKTSTAALGPIGVMDMNLTATSVQLDVRQAHTNLDAAKKALQSSDKAEALSALRAVQQGVFLNFSEVDMPLAEARRNLAMAKIYASDGKQEYADQLLENANGSLEQYSARVGKDRASDVEGLRKEIQTALNSTSSKKGNPDPSLTDKIAGWWDRATDWMS